MTKNGAKPHTALETDEACLRYIPYFKSSSKRDGLLLMEQSFERNSSKTYEISIHDLKFVLTEAWNSIDQVTIQLARTTEKT